MSFAFCIPALRGGSISRRRQGFTLLEVLLALALSGVLIGVLAMAIRMQLRATDSGRTDVAQSQVARALLKRIGDDVRGAVWYEPIDPNAMVVPPKSSSLGGAGNSSSGSSGPSMTGVASGGGGNSGASGGGTVKGNVRSSSAPSSAGGTSSTSGTTGTTSTSTTSTTSTTNTTSTTSTTSSASTTTTPSGASGGSGGGGGGGGGGGSATNASVTTTQNLAQAAMLYPAPMMPAFVGGPNWLQVDVSTLPRSDQVILSQGTQSAGMGGNLLSDMKTISYYMTGGANMPQVLATQVAGGGQGKGLLRREVPRATSVAASNNAGSSPGNASLPEPLAPEVVGIEFQYSDGVTRYPTWDSRQHNSLPKLVWVTVTFLADNMDPKPDELPSASNPKPTVKYTLAVSPAAWRPVPAWLTAMMSSAASGGTSSTSGSSMQGTGAF